MHKTCKYTRDPGRKKQQTDRWQLAVETQNLGTGDCEDSAILLTDWLLARGIEAKVALGKYGDIGGHAWCVARVDDREYLLESTMEGNPDIDRPPLVSRVGSRYVPEVMFDRWHIYVRAFPQKPWDGDYWSEKNWIALDPRANRAAEDPLANRHPAGPETPSEMSQSPGAWLDPSRMAYIKRIQSEAAPFLKLRDMGSKSGQWRLSAATPGWEEPQRTPWSETLEALEPAPMAEPVPAPDSGG